MKAPCTASVALAVTFSTCSFTRSVAFGPDVLGGSGAAPPPPSPPDCIMMSPNPLSLSLSLTLSPLWRPQRPPLALAAVSLRSQKFRQWIQTQTKILVRVEKCASIFAFPASGRAGDRQLQQGGSAIDQQQQNTGTRWRREAWKWLPRWASRTRRASWTL